MKLISLNAWGGRQAEALFAFLRQHNDVDVFCLQEIWNGAEECLDTPEWKEYYVHKNDLNAQLYVEIAKVLDSYVGYFRPNYFEFSGISMFIKRGISILEEGEFFIYRERGYSSPKLIGDHSRNLQYCTIKTTKGNRTIINLHGLWNGNGKSDSEDRLEQSRRIIKFVEGLKNPYVLIGDFNLLPDTESMKTLEKVGMRNLIKEYGISSTRTELYKKECQFADYALVSDGIRINEFKVLSDVISDHCPLYLDFE